MLSPLFYSHFFAPVVLVAGRCIAFFLILYTFYLFFWGDGSITYSATKVDNFLTNLRSGTIDSTFNIDTDLSIFARTYVSALAGGNTTGVCPTSYGIVLTFRGNGNAWIWQIAISTDNTKFIRQNINNTGWDTWRQF